MEMDAALENSLNGAWDPWHHHVRLCHFFWRGADGINSLTIAYYGEPSTARVFLVLLELGCISALRKENI